MSVQRGTCTRHGDPDVLYAAFTNHQARCTACTASALCPYGEHLLEAWGDADRFYAQVSPVGSPHTAAPEPIHREASRLVALAQQYIEKREREGTADVDVKAAALVCDFAASLAGVRPQGEAPPSQPLPPSSEAVRHVAHKMERTFGWNRAVHGVDRTGYRGMAQRWLEDAYAIDRVQVPEFRGGEAPQ